ncbi:NADH-quinone oxidoreductase subunit D [Dissulfurirhabdus thermomarina]|uniref:NADH-quinone oxidoreductase subunit D n=1 Tax=Dissulfurirhabdus thermomarina TaxID=1765737 RepID=A0A6N9TNZ5_DISTH|nr:NADH-quinone oxidoreductase subunit D [Dissulfurirhabdus thermomarina]NDY41474.1 NADH-quinone oxidoreductase subunit D [Dissulfurirhabdus thermomarina]NMX24244.1 NADH-quinone oxidoreductase subunit D [Dissulfurirhabdus thermomarina]
MDVAESAKVIPAAAGECVTINIGPSHPAMHGTLRVIAETDGETIIRAEPEIGYLHRGVEKLAENLSYHQFIPITDRLNYCSAIANNVSYEMAVEKLLGIEVPEKAQLIRLIMMELARISDHIVCVGILGVDLGAFTPFFYLFIQREEIYEIFEWYNGARLTNTFGRIGGVEADLPPDFDARWRELVPNLRKAIDETDRLLTHNRIWMDRTIGVSAFSAEDALNWGFTGPCLRACGVRRDLRKDEPYGLYDQFDFEVPVGRHGDVFDRYMVRMIEMEQSIRLIEQAYRRYKELPPDAPLMAKVPKVLKAPDGEVYHAIEAPNGELGFFIKGDGTDKPYRVRIRPPCYMVYQAFPEMVQGEMVADLIACLSSLNVIAGELDR